MICREDGGILDDLIVYRLADEHSSWSPMRPTPRSSCAPSRSGSVGGDAQVLDRCDDWSLLAIQGPNAASILSPLTEVDLPGLAYYTIATGTVAGRSAYLARTGYTRGGRLRDLLQPRRRAGDLGGGQRGRGRPGLIPCGLACRDSLRLEAAMPLYGNELSVELTPRRGGLGRIVGLKKAGGLRRQGRPRRAGHPPGRPDPGRAAPEGRRHRCSGTRPRRRRGGRRHGDQRCPSPTLGHPSRWRASTPRT